MARLDAIVYVAVQELATGLATRRVALMARDACHCDLFTHALFGNEHDAWRAWLAVWVAWVVGKRGMPAGSRPGARVSALGNRSSARNWRILHCSTACTR
jgi:hypothetical protein